MSTPVLSDLDQVQSLAEAFVQALIARDWARARQQLDASARTQWPEGALHAAWDAMLFDQQDLGYFPELIAVDPMEGWDAWQPGDLGWAYVPVASAECNEAVAIIAHRFEGLVAIRQVEFGRP